MPYPGVKKEFSYGSPASTPSPREMLSVWTAFTAAADTWLSSLTGEDLQKSYECPDGQPGQVNV